jgi:site-specific recombinase XerD
VDGFVGKEEIRRSLRTKDWERAQAQVREWEAQNQITPEPEGEPRTVNQACDRFEADAGARHLRETTLYKYRLLFRQLQTFAEQRGVRYLNEFGLELWSDFRATWPNRNVAALKKLGYLRTFLRFCHDNGWIPENPSRKLRSPRVTQRPTMPFTQDEMIKILAAARPGSRVRALVLLLRYTGLRIHDAVTLKRDRVGSGNLLLYTAKTGVLVYCPLPYFVVTALGSLPPRGEYFFWTGFAKPKSVTSYWQRRLQILFRRAKVMNGHAHRFRDTFAVELLLAGTPIERVAALLGHTSIKTTERHYAPWTRSRQEQLEADVRRAWLADPVAFAETKGTPEVHGKSQRVN